MSFSLALEETVLNEIKRQFGFDRLQYVCVAKEMKQPDMKPHLHIQIILKVRMNKKKWFLDDITGLFFFSYKNFYNK